MLFSAAPTDSSSHSSCELGQVWPLGAGWGDGAATPHTHTSQFTPIILWTVHLLTWKQSFIDPFSLALLLHKYIVIWLEMPAIIVDAIMNSAILRRLRVHFNLLIMYMCCDVQIISHLPPPPHPPLLLHLHPPLLRNCHHPHRPHHLQLHSQPRCLELRNTAMDWAWKWIT